ncbi:neuronal PAS domain-containing protein 4B-like [Esox lucius]|uniref:Neuronal PAS domain protein 4b n=1 Tax=Esox lucius TaxID=8010 RepID=A0A3P9A5H4_ESOLU|nr:neuronal PAS domain-containing protein 4B-like [Esox lucius]
MYRSTKGASKARRDQINAEIRNLKELLPISDTDKARLSYLHIMSLACMYTRKSLFFSQDFRQDETTDLFTFPELSEMMNEFSGFTVLLTSDGKLLYLSDNVADHLGHCMVDLVAQSDSVYDIINPVDHFVMRNSLVSLPTADTDTERLFRCRFNTTKFIRRQGMRDQLMLIRARCLTPPCPASNYWISNPVWVFFCTPLKTNTMARSAPLTPPAEQSFLLACFQSQHQRDMRLLDAEESVCLYLGYDVKSLRSRSWYSLIHPRDLSHACEQHQVLLSGGGERKVEVVLQVEAADHSWVWLYMILQLNIGEAPVSCHNYVISESEAWSIRQQLCLEQNQFPGFLGSGESLSSPDQVFTPSSSGLSAHSFDFSTTPAGGSACEELMQPGGSVPELGLSPLDEQNLPQIPGGQHQWESKTTNLSVGPTTVYPPPSMTDPESDIQTQRRTSVLKRSEPLPSYLTKPLAPLSMHQPQQMGEFACTPPYTPHYGCGHFPFGEKLQLSLDEAVACPLDQTVIMSSYRAPALHSDNHQWIQFPAETQTKLPTTTNSFRTNECSIVGLPQIRGPLYVNVPQRPHHGPLNELPLTPDASPTHPPCSFFSIDSEQEREKEDISLLAKYISSLAEGFSCDPVLPEVTPSNLLSNFNFQATSQNSPFGNECEPCQGPDAVLSQDDISPYEESVLLQSLIKELSSLPLSSSSSSASPSSSAFNSSPPCSPLTPVAKCIPNVVEGEPPLDINHICSVQPTQCSRMAVVGAMMAVRTEPVKRTEDSCEIGMDVKASAEPQLPLPSSAISFTDFQECATALVQPSPAIGLPHAQSLLEELGAMEPLFEADASFTPSWGHNLSCINSHSTVHSPSFYQDGSLRDHAF